LKIIVNKEIIDFSLENEKTVGQVFDHIKKWLEEQSFYITELWLNEEEAFLHQRQNWEERDVSTIESLKIHALTKKEQMLKDLETLGHYFRMYIQALTDKNESLLRDLAREYPYIKANLPHILQLDEYLFDSQLNSLMENSGVLDGKIDNTDVENLIVEWQNILTLLERRRAEFVEPWEEGRRTAQTLVAMKPQLSEVSLLFQEGKDRQALELIIVLTELFSRLFRILGQLEGLRAENPELQEYVDTFRDILLELTEAIKNDDTILMGDLVEYEILDKLDFLPTLFEGGKQA